MTDRNRPRRTLSLDPVTEAYLGQPVVNAGRLVDQLVRQNVTDAKLIDAALEAGITDEDTDFPLQLDAARQRRNSTQNDEEDA